MIFTVGWTCPHCQHTGQLQVDCKGFGWPDVVQCDVEAAGCGAYVAVICQIDHVIRATAHKIDGVGPQKTGGAK